jgi:sialate O-acetylesterase
MKYLKLISFLFLLLALQHSKADVSMPYVFSSNMVLQRDMEIPVWGWAGPEERINIRFGEQKLRIKADKSGNWMIKLTAMDAGGPYKHPVVYCA